jgi:hypothetical protein
LVCVLGLKGKADIKDQGLGDFGLSNISLEEKSSSWDSSGDYKRVQEEVDGGIEERVYKDLDWGDDEVSEPGDNFSHEVSG